MQDLILDSLRIPDVGMQDLSLLIELKALPERVGKLERSEKECYAEIKRRGCEDTTIANHRIGKRPLSSRGIDVNSKLSKRQIQFLRVKGQPSKTQILCFKKYMPFSSSGFEFFLSDSPYVTDLGKYLGAPMIHGRVIKQTYKDLISRMQARLAFWEKNFLSMAGRLILVQMIRGFLWGETSGVRKINSIAWERVCLPKEQGGLNVRDTRAWKIGEEWEVYKVLVGFMAAMWPSITSCKSEMNFLWNGEMTSYYKPSRGLRQGDPLSPYLFVLCLQKLEDMIEMAVHSDDLMFFGEASSSQCQTIIEILEKFCSFSGQRVNLKKCRFFTSANVPSNVIAELKDVSLFWLIALILVSIWVSHFIRPEKSSSCTICNKQIASYTMQSTRLPISVANEIDSINRKFLWGSSDDKRIIPLVKWDVNFSTINRRKRSGLACQFRLFEERRDLAAARMAARQQQVARHYNSRVRARRFQVGDLVMCSCEASRPARDQNKLSPNWEGPYRITKLLKEVSKRIPGPWLVTGDFNTVRKKQHKTGKPLTLESKDTTRPSSSTQFEEQNRGDGEEELEIENSSTSIVDLVAVEKTVNEVSAADCALTFVPPTVNEGVKIARLKPECEGGGKVEIGFNWLCVRIDTEVGELCTK
ncbi:hypothetical protein ZIOFF_051741 [Zingiber officinale]|uniref:Reverse transcriptase domain-containing protein n=1 Tax=Zingiber officinale TaxID=94328 RepID=A0A8J5KRY0_ZINOF|nr:hypothetical protein ZIOFF_051741 [Zingiber officinale]